MTLVCIKHLRRFPIAAQIFLRGKSLEINIFSLQRKIKRQREENYEDESLHNFVTKIRIYCKKWKKILDSDNYV